MRKAVVLGAVIRNLHVIFIKNSTTTHTGVNFLSIEAGATQGMTSGMATRAAFPLLSIQSHRTECRMQTIEH